MTRGRALVLTSVLGLLTAVMLVVFVIRLSQSDRAEVDSGARVFRAGQASRLAPEIAEGGPFLFKDPLTRGAGRELYLQHLGEDVKEGWIAFEARARGAGEDCILETGRKQGPLRDPCSGRVYPATGEGLVTYPATVNDDGIVEVNLRPPNDDT